MRDRCIHVGHFTSARQETLPVVALHKAAQGNDGGARQALTALYLKMEVRFSAPTDAQGHGQFAAPIRDWRRDLPDLGAILAERLEARTEFLNWFLIWTSVSLAP